MLLFIFCILTFCWLWTLTPTFLGTDGQEAPRTSGEDWVEEAGCVSTMDRGKAREAGGGAVSGPRTAGLALAQPPLCSPLARPPPPAAWAVVGKRREPGPGYRLACAKAWILVLPSF